MNDPNQCVQTIQFNKMLLQSKIIFAFLALSVCFIPLNVVLGKPNTNLVQTNELIQPGQYDTGLAENELNRTRRFDPVIPISLAAALGAVSIINSGKCSNQAGCHNGYCWAWCGVSLSDGEWCYTTLSYSQSYRYVKCNADWDCNRCWKCAGPCTLSYIG